MFEFRFYCDWQAFDDDTLRSLEKTHSIEIEHHYGFNYRGPHYLEIHPENLAKGFVVLRDLKREVRRDYQAITKVMIDGGNFYENLPQLFEAVEKSISKLKSSRGRQPSHRETDIRRLLQKSLNFHPPAKPDLL